MAERSPLNAAAVVAAAAAVADRGGLAAVSMRNVGVELGVEAMSLYHHVANKDGLLDALADWVFAQIEVPAADVAWRPAMAGRARSARRVLGAHPWALGLVESRRMPGTALLDHHNAVLANLRTNGFSVAAAASAFSVLDAYVYGFVLTEANLPFGAEEGAEEFVDEIRSLLPAERYPYLNEMIVAHVVGKDYDYGDEFERGLGLILDGLAASLATGS